MIKNVMLIALLLAFSSSLAMADNIRYKASGDWFDTLAVGNVGDNGWRNNDSGVAGLPTATDNARFNWGDNTVTLAGIADDVGSLQLGVDESGTLEVNSGGAITTIGDVLAGNNNVAATGTLTVNAGGVVNVGNRLRSANNDSDGFINVNSGGVVNVSNHMWWGITGTSTINISGTIQQNGGILGLGTDDASTASGGTAQVNILDGGLLALNNIHGEGTSIFAGSFIDITGSGELTLPDDFVGVLTTYATNGFIGGNGVAGMSNLTIDTTKNNGFTTAYVTVVPEPASLLLLGLGLGGILIRRRR